MARPTLKDDPFSEGWSRKELREWFARRIMGLAAAEMYALGARAAARALPEQEKNVGPITGFESQILTTQVIACLRCFQSSAVAAILPPDEIERYREAAGSAYAAARIAIISARSHRDFRSDPYFDSQNESDSTALVAAASVADAVRSSIPAYIASAIAFAAAAAADFDPAFCAAFEMDCRLLDTGGIKALLRARLWPRWDGEVTTAFGGVVKSGKGGGMPPPLRAKWGRMHTALEEMGEGFDIWAGWYEAILAGERNGRYLFGLPTERALRLNVDIALIDEKLWKDPAKVNAEIRRLVEVARGEAAKEEEGETDIPTIPAQALGPKFGAVEERLELIEAGNEDERPDKRGQTLLDELRDTFDDLASAMSPHDGVPNDHPKLRKLLTRYGAVIHLDNPNPDLIFTWGLRLEEALRAAKREIATRDQPELEDEAKSALESLVRLNAIFVATSESGKELLDAAERYAYSRAGDDQFRKAAEPVVKKMDIDAIATEKAIDIIKGAVEDINTGTHPHRQGLVAKNTVGNAVSYLGNAAVQGVVGNATFEIIKVGGGAAFVAASTDITVKAVQFFVANAPELAALVQASPESLGWVTHLIRWIRMRLKL